jgi:hypothetical protein
MSLYVPSAANYWTLSDAATSRVRFDTGGIKAGKVRGAVFTDAKVVYSLSLSDPAVNETARHIDDAFRRAQQTFPSYIGKSVPGKVGETEPLRRLWDTTKNDANRDAAVKNCNDVWGPYDGTTRECDEYPFATTYEGAAKGDNRYSSRLITPADNREAGKQLQATYTLNRLLDNDVFWTSIVP